MYGAEINSVAPLESNGATNRVAFSNRDDRHNHG